MFINEVFIMLTNLGCRLYSFIMSVILETITYKFHISEHQFLIQTFVERVIIEMIKHVFLGQNTHVHDT